MLEGSRSASLAKFTAAVLLIVGTLCGAAAKGNADDTDIREWIDKELVIVRSTGDYEEAKRIARDASTRLAIPLDLRDLTPDARIGLTHPKAVCEENGWSWPCYVARGRYDDGIYASVERSDAYRGFAKGYYIVIIASGPREDAALAGALSKARAAYADAYAKAASVYMGCIH